MISIITYHIIYDTGGGVRGRHDPRLHLGPAERRRPLPAGQLLRAPRAVLGGSHSSDTTCLIQVSSDVANNVEQILTILDTTKSTQHKRGRIRQVALDK